MVVNDKALAKEMKKAYTGWGYTVIVQDDGTWVIQTPFWVVTISCMSNVPNEVLSVIALHMGILPTRGEAYRVYKGDDGPVLQKEVFNVAMDPILNLEDETNETAEHPSWIMRSTLKFGKTQVWQQPDDLRILLIDPRYEALIDAKTEVRTVGNAIYAEGNISAVYVYRVDDDRSKVYIEHLARMQWVQKK